MTIIMPGNIGEITPYIGNKFYVASDGHITSILSDALKYEKETTNIENINIIVL